MGKDTGGSTVIAKPKAPAPASAPFAPPSLIGAVAKAVKTAGPTVIKPADQSVWDNVIKEADQQQQADGGSGGDTSGDTSSGSRGGTVTPPTAINWDGVDFSNYLKVWGLPADVQARVLQIFQTAGDAGVAAQLALAYIRQTDWYAQTFPGIQVAEAKGLVNNEADYRALLNQQTQVYKQYLGRDITSGEFAANLTEGVNNTVIGQRLQGAVYAKTYGGDWNQALGAFGDNGPASQQDLTTLGQEKAGLDTPMGQLLQRRLDQAQQRLAGVFKGSLATPALSFAGGRLAGPQAGQPPDTAA